MIWQDVMVDKELSTEEVAVVLSQMLHIDQKEVVFRTDLYELIGKDTQRKAVVTYSPLRGDFVENLDINIVDPELRKKHESQPDEEFFQEFCRLANCSCLLSDEDLNPWTYTLIKPNGEMHSVEIEAEDEEDEDLVELMPQFKHLID